MPSKLHDHLLLLRPEERKPFLRFLQSPYHNRQPLLVDLCQILSRHLYQEPPREMGEEEAAAHLFPGEAFDRNRYRKLATALLQCLRDFWVAEALRGDRPRQELYLLRRLNDDHADRFVPSQVERARAALDSAELRLMDAKAMALAIEKEAYTFEARQAERSPEINPQAMLQHLETSYLAGKIWLLYHQVNHFRITGQGELPQADAFLETLGARLPELPLEVRLYYHLYRCASDPARLSDYHALRRDLKRSADALLAEEVGDLYAGALNFCTQRINHGDEEFLREMWTIYAEMMQKGLLMQGNSILQAHFKNIMAISARLREYAWAAELLDRMGLEEGGRLQNGLHFGRGVLAYYQGREGEAARHFHRILDDYEDMWFALDARVYLLRIYYETGDVAGLDSLCESFRMYLKRNKRLPRARKANYNHFVSCMRRLGRIPSFDKERLQKLRDDIATGRRISATAWLLEKVDKLMGP